MRSDEITLTNEAFLLFTKPVRYRSESETSNLCVSLPKNSSPKDLGFVPRPNTDITALVYL